jgi:hypothetical protein
MCASRPLYQQTGIQKCGNYPAFVRGRFRVFQRSLEVILRSTSADLKKKRKWKEEIFADERSSKKQGIGGIFVLGFEL